MKSKNALLTYHDISEGHYVDEEKEKKVPIPDPKLSQDIVTLFQIKELEQRLDNFSFEKNSEIEKLSAKLNYQHEEKNTKSYLKALENITWEKKVLLQRQNEKMNVLRDIQQKGLVIDKIDYEENGEQMIGLSVVIMEIDDGDNNNEDAHIWIQPEFTLDKTGTIQPGDEDMSFDIPLDNISEIIVDGIKYLCF